MNPYHRSLVAKKRREVKRVLRACEDRLATSGVASPDVRSIDIQEADDPACWMPRREGWLRRVSYTVIWRGHWEATRAIFYQEDRRFGFALLREGSVYRAPTFYPVGRKELVKWVLPYKAGGYSLDELEMRLLAADSLISLASRFALLSEQDSRQLALA